MFQVRDDAWSTGCALLAVFGGRNTSSIAFSPVSSDGLMGRAVIDDHRGLALLFGEMFIILFQPVREEFIHPPFFAM